MFSCCYKITALSMETIVPEPKALQIKIPIKVPNDDDETKDPEPHPPILR